MAASFAQLVTVACTTIDASTVQELSAWGLGWQFTAVQNRIQPAIPPVMAFLRERDPVIRRADLQKSLGRDFRSMMGSASPAFRDRADRRMIGVFLVNGLSCAAEGFPVRADGRTVAAFIVLDATVAETPPLAWRSCGGGRLTGDRPAALRTLIGGAMETALKSR